MTTTSKTSDGVTRCRAYIDGVLDGSILAPVTVKLACERFNRDKDNPAVYFDARAANAAVNNITASLNANSVLNQLADTGGITLSGSTFSATG